MCAAKFGGRTTCPDCLYKRGFWRLSDARWQCRRCGKRFGILTGTNLERTTFSLPETYELLHWFELDLTDNNIARRVEVDYRRVHRFLLRVRENIRAYEERSIRLLGGSVEVDESYFGPRFKNRRKLTREKLRKEGVVKRGRGSKELQQPVFGIYERMDGIVYIRPVADARKDTLQSIIREKVNIETTIYSDTWKGYNGLEDEYRDHKRVNHGEHEYRNGNAYINGIEGFWGYAKERLLLHHGVSGDNFLSYLKEKEFRFNNRHLKPEDFIAKLLEVILRPNHSVKR
jgi:transposase-like protein